MDLLAGSFFVPVRSNAIQLSLMKEENNMTDNQKQQIKALKEYGVTV